MKAYYCLYVVILFSACVHKDTNVNIYEPGYYRRITTPDDSAREMYVIYKSKIDSNLTLFRSYWDNGKLQGISYFLKSVKTGPWVRYFDDGRISFEGNYINGKKNGIHKIYFSNGKLSAIEEYTNDSKTGEWFYYNEDGSLLRSEELK